jgi:hypothetical protein
MKTLHVLFFIISLNIVNSQNEIQKTWTTYLLKNNVEITNTIIDNERNVIITAIVRTQQTEDLTTYSNFTTSGCHQAIPNGGNEAFIAKFSPNGEQLWATFFGGTQTEFSRYLICDSNNNIYLGCDAKSLTNIATAGSYLSIADFSVFNNNTFGSLSKFSSTGNLIWSTYIPGDVEFIQLKNDNEIYIGGDSVNNTNLISTPGSYKEIAPFYVSSISNTGNNSYRYLMKFDGNGNRLAGTYLEKTHAITGFIFNIDIQGNIITAFTSFNPTSEATNSTSQQPTYGGDGDVFIMKMSGDLSTKLWATYYGGSNLDQVNDLIVDGDYFYLVGDTESTTMATTGAFQENLSGTDKDGFIAKFTTDGTRVWSSYFGGSGRDFLESVVVNDNKLYVAGRTRSSGLATLDGFQNNYTPLFTGTFEEYGGLFAQFTLDGARNWSSYFNGGAINSMAFGDFDGFYLSGYAHAVSNIGTQGSWQPNFLVDIPINRPYNGFLAKMEFQELNITQFNPNDVVIAPNPAQHILTIAAPVTIQSVEIISSLGQHITSQSINNVSGTIDVAALPSGVYFLKISSYNNEQVTKFIKE